MKKIILYYSVGCLLLLFLMQLANYFLTIKYQYREFFILTIGLTFMAVGIFVAGYFKKQNNPLKTRLYSENSTLSSAENEVLKLLLLGKKNAEIAEQRHVSLNTVKTQLRSIYDKLDVKSRSELIATFLQEN